MSKSICFYFQVHQPYRLRTYRFFEIGKKHYYYDDYSNRMIMRRVAEKCYLPMNELLMRQIEKWGDQFKVAFSFSGVVIEQMEQYAPEVLESFQKLVAKVPLKEMSSYSTALSSLTGGRASFSMKFASYELVPADVQSKLIKEFEEKESEE